MFIDILGYSVYSGSKSDCIDLIMSKEKVHVVSGNPEVLYSGLEVPERYNNFCNQLSSIIIPDGVGVKLAAKVKKQAITEKIAGIDVMRDIFYRFNGTQQSVYILGSTKENIELCVKEVKRQYKELNVCGYRDGYFDLEDEANVVQNINDKRPTAVFVAMGCPRQEDFIIRNMGKINAKVFMGVGGSVDVFAGKVNRAPKWMISCGLEWLYRVIKEPVRILRLGAIPKFMFRVTMGKGNR